MDEISQSALLLIPLLKRLFNGDPGDPALALLRNQTFGYWKEAGRFLCRPSGSK